MKRWEHGHSLGAGVLGGLLLASHTWTVAVLAFTLGCLVGLTASVLLGAAGRLRGSVERARRRRRGLHGLGHDLDRIGWALRGPDRRGAGRDATPPPCVGYAAPAPRAQAEESYAAPFDFELGYRPAEVPGVRFDERGQAWYSAAWL